MLNVGIITGSTRPNRQSETVARWVLAAAEARGDARYELVDIAAFDLPLFDEPLPPMAGQQAHAHTRRWAAKVAELDAFVFVTPEYNHSMPAALKNAIDFLHKEWGDKSAGFVSYGSAVGTRAVEHLRAVMGALAVADVRTQVGLSLFDDFEAFSIFKPRPLHQASFAALLDEVVGWGAALKAYRDARAAK